MSMYHVGDVLTVGTMHGRRGAVVVVEIVGEFLYTAFFPDGACQPVERSKPVRLATLSIKPLYRLNMADYDLQP